MNYPTALVIDVESIGLHGEAFAVAGGIYRGKHAISEFTLACPPESATGNDSDRTWVKANVHHIPPTSNSPREMRDAFWDIYSIAKSKFQNIQLFAECLWPVEARFLIDCINDDPKNRNWEGPYPFHDIASFLAAAGMDPLASYSRLTNELPAHHPLHDARQSARLLSLAIDAINQRP